MRDPWIPVDFVATETDDFCLLHQKLGKLFFFTLNALELLNERTIVVPSFTLVNDSCTGPTQPISSVTTLECSRSTEQYRSIFQLYTFFLTGTCSGLTKPLLEQLVSLRVVIDQLEVFLRDRLIIRAGSHFDLVGWEYEQDFIYYANRYKQKVRALSCRFPSDGSIIID